MGYIGTYTNPVSLPDASQNKNYKWFLSLCKGAMYAYHVNALGVGAEGLCLKTYVPLATKRAYFLNQQSIEKIRQQLDPLDEKTNRRKYNIDWGKVDYHTKSLNGQLSKLLAYNYAPRTVAIDEASLFTKNVKVNKSKLLASPEHKAIAQEIGYTDPEAINAEDAEDVEMIDVLGGVRLEAEIQLKNAVEHSLEDSNFKLTLQPMFLADCFIDNRMIATVEVDPHTERPCVKYIDIASAFYVPSKETDNRNIPMGGYVEKMTIPTLRAFLYQQAQKGEGKTKYADVEKTLQSICNMYKGSTKTNTYNTNALNIGALEYYQKHGYYAYDHFTVDVMTIWVIASDTRTYIKGLNDFGAFELRQGSNKDDGDDAIKNTTQNVYRCRWVVGTDYVFDYGVDDVIVREGAKGNKKAVLPMVVYASPKSSMIDRIMPIIDEINKITFRQRQLLNQMIPEPSMIIDIAKLHESVIMGGVKMDMGENIANFRKDGVLIINSKNEFGEDLGGSNSKAVEFLTQPAVRQMIELAQIKAGLVTELEASIGDNAIANGSQTSAELLVGVQQGATQAATNALSDIVLGYRQFATQIGKLLMRKYETMIQAGEEISGVFFSENVKKQYKLSKELLSESAEFAFSMEMMPSQEEKQALIQSINAAYEKMALTTSEMAICNMLILNDDIKAVQYFMAKAEKKAAKLAHERQMQITQGQAQAQGDSAVKAEEAKTQAQIAIDNNKAVNDEKLLRVKYELELQALTGSHANAMQLENHRTENTMLANAAQTQVESDLMPKNTPSAA